MTKWIKISEQLPPENEYVTVISSSYEEEILNRKEYPLHRIKNLTI